MTGIQFLTNEAGHKTAVLIDLKRNRVLWEDFYHTLLATTGFTLSPLMARLLAEQIATGKDTLPPAYAVDRGAHAAATT